MNTEQHIEELAQQLKDIEAAHLVASQQLEGLRSNRRALAGKADILRQSIDASRRYDRPIDMSVIGAKGIETAEGVGKPGG